MDTIKSILKSGLDRHIAANYKLSLKKEAEPYSEWIEKREETLPKYDMSVSYDKVNGEIDVHSISYSAKYEGVSVRIIPYSTVLENFSIMNCIEDILIFVNGELTECAIPLIVEEFEKKPAISVLYGDEDIVENEDEPVRELPFFKPAWSPNTFLDHFYFCNIVALRRGAFRLFEWSKGYTGAASIYHTLIRYLYNDEVTLRTKVGRISEVLVHASDYNNNYIKDALAEGLAKRVTVDTGDVLSIIIPSKDNPHLLRTCIGSIVDNKPDDLEIEVIVVDNGSSESNLNLIDILKKEYNFTHIYKPMEFNFALMCNMGAEAAKGELLLFLNDDVTITSKESLSLLVSQVKYSFSGAVGTKLLYPDTTKIQHAGVFNTRIGPAHKLQFQNDDETHYFGFNKSVNNVLAVTGACIMIRKEVYRDVAGMNEALKVAFNDIDLCFKLYEKGYVNVVCNNTFMYHAESITRGRDTTEEAIIRLWNERDRLYEEHPMFKAYDPFYSKNLVNDCLDTRFVPACEYEFDKVHTTAEQFDSADLKTSRDEPCVQIGVEYSGEVGRYTFGEEYLEKEQTEIKSDDYYIQGFSYLMGSDNALYKKKILLQNVNTLAVMALTLQSCYRSDVASACTDETNVEMSGIAMIIPGGLLPEGRYRIGIMYEKIMSREVLHRFTNNYIEVTSR